jgi:ABC-type bacteriocin/lantibiotic exporter with double-glycine peptidase domain
MSASGEPPASITDIDPAAIETTGDPKPVSSLAKFVWRMSAKHQFFISLLAILLALLSMAPLELKRRIVNRAIGDLDLELLLWLAGIYLGVVLLQGGLKYLLRVYQGWIGESVIRYCRNHLFGVHRRRRDGAGNRADGQAVSIIGAEIEQLGGFVGEALSTPLVNGGMLLAMFGYMVVVQPMIAGVSILFFIPQILSLPLLQRWINRLIDRRITMLRGLGDMVADENGGSDEPGSGEPKATIDAIYRNRIRIYLLKFAGKALVNLMNALAPVSVLVVGGYLAIQGETSVGVIVAFISGFERMAGPMTELVAYYRLAAQMRIKHDRIAEWI